MFIFMFAVKRIIKIVETLPYLSDEEDIAELTSEKEVLDVRETKAHAKIRSIFTEITRLQNMFFSNSQCINLHETYIKIEPVAKKKTRGNSGERSKSMRKV